MASNLLIINYHYVRRSFPISGIHGISPERFSNQIERIISLGYKFLSLTELTELINNNFGVEKSEKFCLITFDDGLKESYENAYVFLQSIGIPAVFFLCSDTLTRTKLLGVHKLQYIRSLVSDETLLSEIDKIFPAFKNRHDENSARVQYPWDSETASILKYIINFELNRKESQGLINLLFDKYFKSEKKLAEELYLSSDQLNHLVVEKSIGSHTISHPALAKISNTAMSKELVESKSTIENYLNIKVDSISYPYGEASAVNEKVFSAAKAAGYKIGFTMNRGLNKVPDLIQNRFQLSRFDTNDVFGGKSSELFQNMVQ